MFTFQFFTYLLVLLVAISILFPVIIEIIKKLVKVPEEDKAKQRYCFIVALILGAISFVIFCVFYPLFSCKVLIDWVKLVIVGILFILASGGGALVGYDNIIKIIKDIWKLFFPVK